MGKTLNFVYDNADELVNIAQLLKELFIYKPNLEYTKETQKHASELLTKFATISGAFDKAIEIEKENIKTQLVVIDKNTNEPIELIDKESIKNRVESVLVKNDFYTCLKSLALSNKCANMLDGPIDVLQERLKYSFKKVY